MLIWSSASAEVGCKKTLLLLLLLLLCIYTQRNISIYYRTARISIDVNFGHLRLLRLGARRH